MVNRAALSSPLFEESKKAIHGPVAAEPIPQKPVEWIRPDFLLTFGVSQNHKPTSYSDVPLIPEPETTITGNLCGIVEALDQIQRQDISSTQQQISQAATAQTELATSKTDQEVEILKKNAKNAKLQFYGKDLPVYASSLISICWGVTRGNPIAIYSGLIGGGSALIAKAFDNKGFKLPLALALSGLGLSLYAGTTTSLLSLIQSLGDSETAKNAAFTLIGCGEHVLGAVASIESGKTQYKIGLLKKSQTEHSHLIEEQMDEVERIQSAQTKSSKALTHSIKEMLEVQSAMDGIIAQILDRRS